MRLRGQRGQREGEDPGAPREESLRLDHGAEIPGLDLARVLCPRAGRTEAGQGIRDCLHGASDAKSKPSA